MRTLEKILLTGTALVTLGAGLVGGACKRDYDITPAEPPALHTPAPNETPVVEPTPQPIPEVKLFELVGDNLTAEQYKTFHDNSLEDYLKVLDVYGIKKEDARMRIGFWPDMKGYTASFYYKDNVGTGGAPGLNDFTTDRRGMRHEIAHAINHTLFPTKDPKDQGEPWYNTLDEGSASYASGMDGVEKNKRKIRLYDVDKEGSVNEMSSDIYLVSKAYELLEENPELYWKRRSGDSPGHATGIDLYWFLMEIYDLTPGKNVIALETLAEKYSETGKLTRKNIQGAYEVGLGLSKGGLNNLFDLLKPGIMILYSTDPATAGTKGAEINKTIRSEF